MDHKETSLLSCQSNIPKIMSHLWCKQEDSRSRCCWEGRSSGRCRSVRRADSRGTAGQSEHRWAHKPGSGLHGPALAAKHKLFPLVLDGKRTQSLSMQNQPDLQQSHNNCYLTTLWGRSAPRAIAQADGGAEAPQLEARITAKGDACPRVMEHTLGGSMLGHRRPAASHH